METRMQFQKDARVVAANGEPLGQIDRVVLKPEDNTVTHIVVDIGTMFKKDEKVVPIQLVTEAAEDQILLSNEVQNLEGLPAFEETHLIETDEEPGKPEPSGSTSMLYGYPTAGVSVGPGSGEKFATQIEQNIPEGSVALKEGAKVITADGKHVGNVERVLANAPAERITHLLISSGVFSKEMKLIPVTWVNIVDEDEVHLRVKKDSVKKLADTSSIMAD